MHLIERYSLACGVKINEPEMLTHFYPLPCEQYVCVSSSPETDSKNYSFWEIVFGICAEAFDRNNIKVIQIGSTKDTKIPNHYDLRGKTNLRQDSFILKNARIYVGVDGFYSHLSSSHGTPSISLYPFSFINCSKPYWGPSLPIAPERNGTLPPFSYNENPKSVDQIKPETIAIEIFKSLGISESVTLKTVYTGARCQEECLDIIPEYKTTIINPKINIRMDKFYNEFVMLDTLSRNFCEVTTDKIFDLSNHFCKKISAVNYVTDDFDVEFVEKLKNLAIKTNLLCISPDSLQRERKKLFDHQIHYFNLSEQSAEKKSKVGHSPLELKIFTKKRVLCGEKFYESLYEYTGDEDDFFLDLDWFYCYK